MLGTFSLTLAVTLSWTNPAWAEDTIQCQPGLVPCYDLATVEVWGHRQWATRDSLLAIVPVGGRAGLRDSVVIALPAVWAIWAVAVDSTGNRSCPSPIVGVNLPASVPPVPSIRYRFEFWYDLAGRRLARKPSSPGVYIRATERETSKVVVLR